MDRHIVEEDRRASEEGQASKWRGQANMWRRTSEQVKMTALQKNNDGWEKNVIKCCKVKPLIRGFDIITIIVILKIPPEFNIINPGEEKTFKNQISSQGVRKKRAIGSCFFLRKIKKGQIFFRIIRTYRVRKFDNHEVS